jgi:uroporphyrinogen-III synthase
MTRGLAGRRIVNTRATHQAEDLDRLIAERGGIPLPYPCIAVAPPEDTAALDEAIRNLLEGAFDWLTLTSGNAAVALAARLRALGLERSMPEGARIGVVGEATRRAALEELGIEPDFVAPEATGASLGESLPAGPGERVLAPGSDIARTELRDALERWGLDVTPIVAYRTVRGTGGVDLPRLLRAVEVDAVAFTSPSAVAGCRLRLEREGGSWPLPAGVVVACIGPTTAAAAEEQGLSPHFPETEHGLERMLDALERALASIVAGGRTG